MSIKGQVILVTLWFAVWLGFVAGTIWGRMAEWTYHVRMQLPFRLILRDKGSWVRFQKGLAWFALVFGALIYRVALTSILRDR